MASRGNARTTIGRSPAAAIAVLALAACGGPPPALSPSDGAAAATRASSGPAGSTLLVIGIDGATFDVLLPLVRDGLAPNLAGLMERGAWGPLATIEPTVSPAIWTTVATGREPADHGILGFEGVPGQTMTTLPTSRMRRVRAFWNILSDAGRSVGLIGWWATWPAEPVAGYVVSDRAAYTRMEATLGPDAARVGDVHPEELAAPVRELVRAPDAITGDEVRRFMPLTDAEIETLIRAPEYRHASLFPEFRYVVQSDRSTLDIALRLMALRPTDLTAVAFYGVDTVSHLAWHYRDPAAFPQIQLTPEGAAKFGGLIDNYYAFVDECVGRLVAAAGPDATVLVFSDHGFGPTGNLPWSGGHGAITPGAPLAPDGVLILAGPPVRSGVRLEGAHVLDVAPTLLFLKGVPAADDMPGKVLEAALRPEVAAAGPRRRIATYETSPLHAEAAPPVGNPAGDRDLLEKMRALGYVQ